MVCTIEETEQTKAVCVCVSVCVCVVYCVYMCWMGQGSEFYLGQEDRSKTGPDEQVQSW